MWPFKNKTKEKKPEEISGQTLFGFTKELVLALGMALVVIFYVIQAFRIPSESMTDTLLVNDFLLGLKFIYGSPVIPGTHLKFPGVTSPKPGDVVIFEYPGSDGKDYIKRCVAGPGDTLELKNKELFINHVSAPLPPQGKYTIFGPSYEMDPRDNFKKLYVPKKGDVLKLSSFETREFFFARGIIHQENPNAKIKTDIQLYINDSYRNNDYEFQYGYQQIKWSDIPFDKDIVEWHKVEDILSKIRANNPNDKVELKKFLYVNDTPVLEYSLQYDCYFMLGDNRDNSRDSRYWGFLNRNFVKAKALILYFSFEKDATNPLQFIRWNRLGKLIH
jgi:signal peptidase I